VTFSWLDPLTWFEEEEPLLAHARDPHKRVDLVASSRAVRVEVDGVLLADSRRPLLLFETALPARHQAHSSARHRAWPAAMLNRPPLTAVRSG
jgi:hypothetical protein